MTQIISSRHYVTDEEVRRTSAIDLLRWVEEKVLVELVRAVHKAGCEGLAWPRIERIPLVLKNGERHPRTDPRDNVYEWLVVAEVEAEEIP